MDDEDKLRAIAKAGAASERGGVARAVAIVILLLGAGASFGAACATCADRADEPGKSSR